MKKHLVLFLLLVLGFSTACQTLFPVKDTPRDGTVISTCANVTSAIRGLQTNDVPNSLYETGVKQGNEFDANEYFGVLPGISMREGYVLDYIFPVDFLGAYPVLAARPVEQTAYTSSGDLPEDSELFKYWNYMDVNDTEQGYFEYTAFLATADQFYLVWHANYNDEEIVCDRADVDDIVTERNTGNFGFEFDKDQMTQIRAMNNIEPLIKLTDTTAVVEIVTFSKWGGFFRVTYTIDRAFPHSIIDVQEENIVPYDCGIMF